MTKCKHDIESEFPCALCSIERSAWQLALPILMILCLLFWGWMFWLLDAAIRA